MSILITWNTKVFCVITWVFLCQEKAPTGLKSVLNWHKFAVELKNLILSPVLVHPLHVMIITRVVFAMTLCSARCDYSLSLANDIQSDRLLLAIKDGQTKHCISIQNQILVNLLCCFIQISSVAVVISKRIVYFCSKFNLNLVSYWNCFGLSLFRYWPANLIAALLLFNLKSGHSK